MKSFTVCCGLLVALFTASVSPAHADAVPCDVYTGAQGEHYLVVGLSGPTMPSTLPREVVFLVDTSASQVGQFRRDSLGVLRNTLAKLPAETKVKLIAVDVSAVPLTSEFVARDSQAAAEALAKLDRRAPLGATNLSAGLLAAGAAFTGNPEAANRAVVYIGDGRNMANTLDKTDYDRVATILTEAKAPLSVCAIGPQVQYDVLGALTNRTGGVLVDFAAVTSRADDAAKRRVAQTQQPQASTALSDVSGALADATAATVVWLDPKANPFPAGWEVYPRSLPPLRSDRETLVVASTTDNVSDVTVQISGTSRTKSVKMTWDLVPQYDAFNSQPHIRRVFEIAKSSGGETFPVVGREMLEALRNAFDGSQAKQLDAAQLALDTNSSSDAATIAKHLLETNPNNKVTQQVVDNTATKALVLEGIPPAAQAPGLVDVVINARDVRKEKISTEVSVALTMADRAMAKYPDETMQNLRLTMAMVRDNAAITPEEREQLLDKLGNKLKHVQREKDKMDRQRLEQAQVEARREERLRALEALDGKSQKLQQIFSRYKHLMSAREYVIAEQAAELAKEVVPNDPTAVAASTLASVTRYVDESMVLRHRRERGFVAGLQSVEMSFVPAADEPPISYPDPALWRTLSERRRERWDRADISGDDSTEKDIRRGLDKTMDITMNPGDTISVEDLLKLIADETNNGNAIPFWFENDPDLVDGENILSDTELTWNGPPMKNVTVRNVLKRLLAPGGFDYCIKDQMLIFAHSETIKKVKYMPPLVYPVSDLTTSMGGGGGMMGGMGGMMGGGMGGMGGGMGGMGGGMMGGMGGGMGGMGGGFGFSIPDKAASEGISQSTIDIATLDTKDPHGWWDRYFAKIETSSNEEQKASRQAIRDIVERLVEGAKKTPQEKRYNLQIIALIESALRHQQMQPWMYEALALSLYLDGAPREEIARAVMSAADICQDPVELVMIAGFAETVGDTPSAISLYRQAITAMPLLRPPYTRLLRLAIERHDDALLEWVTLAIARQEWGGPVGERLTQDSRDAFAMRLEQLRREGKTGEADKYAMAMAEASLRDCRLEISWTGDALLTVAVKEPNGSLCWALNPQTVGGGVWSEKSPAEAKESKVVYSCPVGFAGAYELSLLKDHGTLTDDSVRVALTHIQDGQAASSEQFFKVGNKGAVVNVTIPEGRRTESLDEAIVATAAATYQAAQESLAVSQFLNRVRSGAIHAQIDPGQYESTGTGTTREAVGVTPIPYAGGYGYNRPYWMGGAVGYRPVIEWIEQGTSLDLMSPVVSSDRRYVLMPNLNMSVENITDVFTYTYYSSSGTGASTTTTTGNTTTTTPTSSSPTGMPSTGTTP